MIACSNLTRRFGSVAVVDAISFDLPQGSICAFLGPNGAGKSTTLNMLAGLLAPTSGTITVAGLNVNGPDTPLALKRQIGVLPEGLGLFDSLSVEEHLHLSGPIYGLSKQETRKRTRDVLRSDRSPRTQRDSVARIASLLGPLATLILRELRRTTSVVGNHFLMFVLFLFAMSPNSAAFLGMVAGLVILFPLSADPLRRLPRERLRLLPLSHPERIRLRALSLLLSPPLWIAVAVPLVWGRRHVGVSLVVLLLAALSNGLALLWEGNAARMQRFNPLRHLPFFPGALGGLVTKNLREMFSVLDPYAGLLLSLAALIFRTTSPKPVPEAMHGMAMLVALTLSSYAQRLFALDGHQGLQRYRLMPLRGWQVLLAKDLAFLLVLTLLVIPMNLVSGLCGGLVLLAVGHGPSVRDPQPQPRWRFVTGARGWSGWIQVFALFGVGALAFSLKGVAGIPCMILYGLSLFHYGRRFDRR